MGKSGCVKYRALLGCKEVFMGWSQLWPEAQLWDTWVFLLLCSQALQSPIILSLPSRRAVCLWARISHLLIDSSVFPSSLSNSSQPQLQRAHGGLRCDRFHYTLVCSCSLYCAVWELALAEKGHRNSAFLSWMLAFTSLKRRGLLIWVSEGNLTFNGEEQL